MQRGKLCYISIIILGHEKDRNQEKVMRKCIIFVQTDVRF